MSCLSSLVVLDGNVFVCSGTGTTSVVEICCSGDVVVELSLTLFTEEVAGIKNFWFGGAEEGKNMTAHTVAERMTMRIKNLRALVLILFW